MGIQLDWQIGEDDPQPPEHRQRRRPLNALVSIGLLLLLAAVLGVGWRAVRQQQAKTEAALRQTVQQLLDQEREALLAGDGDLFMANFAADPALQAAQLRPENQAAVAAGLTVTRVSAHGEELWANVRWQPPGSEVPWQRVLFFRQEAGRLWHIPAGSGYWGSRQQATFAWGILRFYEPDAALAAEIAATVATTIDTLCAAGCRPERQPFTLILANDYAASAAPDEVRLPSPRLLALDEAGRPAGLFWQQLQARLAAHLTPGTIRFAVPDELLPHYQELLPAFAIAQPDIEVTLVAMSSLPADPAGRLASVDGLAQTPTEAMLAAGLVHDLTDFARTDRSFDQVDFYDQLWRAAWWRERMWLMPQSGRLPVLYFARDAYAQAARPEPSVRWTWAEMDADLQALAATRPGTGSRRQWALVDEDRDLVYAYAYSQQKQQCRTNDTDACTMTVSAMSRAAAFVWVASLAGQPGLLPDLTGLTSAERGSVVLNLVAPRRVAMWVDEPVFYELHLQRGALGVQPFPGSEQFDGVTPLWVEGSVISQASSRPGDVWLWLKFLSEQYLARQRRQIPARPSVAEATGYWQTLPRPLGDVLRTAFPFARPVLIAEQELFTWEQLAAVTSGRVSPAEAAQSTPGLHWFGR